MGSAAKALAAMGAITLDRDTICIRDMRVLEAFSQGLEERPGS